MPSATPGLKRLALRATGIPATDEGCYAVLVTLPGGAPRINVVPCFPKNQV